MKTKVLRFVEFAYNSSINRYTGLSPFEVVTRFQPQKPIDLIHIPPQASPSEPIESFAKHIQDIHIEIRRKINLSYELYKSVVDFHHRSQKFERDMVMMRVRPKRFLRQTLRKLHSKTLVLTKSY